MGLWVVGLTSMCRVRGLESKGGFVGLLRIMYRAQLGKLFCYVKGAYFTELLLSNLHPVTMIWMCSQ